MKESKTYYVFCQITKAFFGIFETKEEADNKVEAISKFKLFKPKRDEHTTLLDDYPGSIR